MPRLAGGKGWLAQTSALGGLRFPGSQMLKGERLRQPAGAKRPTAGQGTHAESTAWGCFLAIVSSLRAA